jgi:hypothetical protein
MVERGTKDTPKPGEHWLQVSEAGQEGELVGFIYLHPITNALMFAGNYFNPFPVKAGMIHGKNRWYRVFPPAE